MTKSELRKWVRQELKTHSTDELQQLSEVTCRLILEHPKVKEAETVIAFWPLPDEVDIRPAVRELYCQGKTILLPHVISDTEMEICQYKGDESLTEGAFGIMEPALTFGETINNEQLTMNNEQWIVESGKCKVESGDYLSSLSSKLSALIFLIPGRAFDRVGHRLGRGKGYYDRFLGNFSLNSQSANTHHLTPNTIGVSYPFQIVDSVPTDNHDILIKELIWRTLK